MKCLVILASLLISSFVFAEINCRDQFITDTESCRNIFKQCMSNPVFQNLCSSQLSNCRKTATDRSKMCEARQQLCVERLIEQQELCKAQYFQCFQKPNMRLICVDELDECSLAAKDNAEVCLNNAYSYVLPSKPL